MRSSLSRMRSCRRSWYQDFCISDVMNTLDLRFLEGRFFFFFHCIVVSRVRVGLGHLRCCAYSVSTHPHCTF